MPAGPPEATVLVPDRVRHLAGGRPVTPVWRNEAGGLTVRDTRVGRYIKVSPVDGPDLTAEAARSIWIAQVAPGLPVPTVVGTGTDDDGSWLVTTALPGLSAVDPHWQAQPALAATAIGAGLRTLHDSLPVDHCPFDWSATSRLSRMPDAAEQDRRRWHSDHRRLSTGAAVEAARRPPPVDQLVVCHADACVPNTLIGGDGNCAGLVDVGGLGVADRWADLAVATWSTVWNYGPGYEGILLDAYGIAPDAERTAYYRLLGDLT